MSHQDNPIVETKPGKIQGLFQNGLYIFKGIPYAAPPVEDLRWLPPQPVPPWKNVRPAREFRPIAPQIKMPPSPNREVSFEEPQSEDCLYLNIWSPGIDDSHRPVMVWIHGGAFSRGSGSSPMHDGTVLAKRGDVVVVTINYRLGALGFLHLDRITGGQIPATGNEGLLDQVAALQWVRDNIAFFGGDPENVTVFGESAGAMSIGCLLSMPRARGLFRKAILQSGSNTFKPLDEAVQLTGELLDILGAPAGNTADLRSIPAEKLVTAYQELGRRLNIKGSVLEPVVDGKILPEYPVEAVRHGSAGNISILIGTNLEESRFMAVMDPGLIEIDEAGLLQRWKKVLPAGLVPDLIDKYQRALTRDGAPAETSAVSLGLQTDVQFRIPAIRLLEAHGRSGQPAYSYLFTWRSPQTALGACHSLEIGFVFGVLVPGFNGAGAQAEKLAGEMQDSWTAFARTGNPGCSSLGEWPRYWPGRKTMILGADCHVEEAPLENERRAWDSVPDKFLG